MVIRFYFWTPCQCPTSVPFPPPPHPAPLSPPTCRIHHRPWFNCTLNTKLYSLPRTSSLYLAQSLPISLWWYPSSSAERWYFRSPSANNPPLSTRSTDYSPTDWRPMLDFWMTTRPWITYQRSITWDLSPFEPCVWY